MEQKDMYTMRELFDHLEITMTELVKRSGISDVTLGKIRSGKSARRDTVNTLLRIFSELYGMKFSLNNVAGILVQGKPISHIAEKVIEPPVSLPVTQQPTSETDKTQKRTYTTTEDIPADWVLCSEFFESYGIKETTQRRWLKNGLEGETFEFEERDRPGRADKFRYFTPTQQEQALDILRKHGKLK